MPSERKIRIWAGMGTWLLAGTGALGLGGDAQAAAQQSGTVAQADDAGLQVAQASHGHGHGMQGAAQGGEGGERGEAGALAGANPDQALAAQLLLIRGHLAVGKELYEMNRADDALPHYLHPSEEIYEELEPALKQRRISGFEQELGVLAGAVKAKRPAAEVAKLQERVVAKLDMAMNGVPEATRAKAAFAAGTAVLVLKVAAEEYEAAIENGRIANAVEYQDSRGFVTASRVFVHQHEKAMHVQDAKAYEAIVKALDDLAKAYPSVVPPEKPQVSAGAFRAAVSSVELQAGNFK